VGDLDALELPHCRERAAVKRDQRSAANLVPAGELPDEQLAVTLHANGAGSERSGLLETAEQGSVLGNIVRGHADRLAECAQRPAVLEDHDPDRGMTRVPPGRTIDADGERRLAVRRHAASRR
jgi:hypothetical protein